MKKLNKKRAVDLVLRLLAVPGKSCQEAAIANVVREILTEAGITDSQMAFDTAHRKTPIPGEVGNLIVKIPGNSKKPRLMLSAHMDTVPICDGCIPMKKGNVIRSQNPATGLGGDDRAGVAAVLVAALETLESGIDHPPLTLCFFVQEEIGLQGSRHMSVSKLGKPAMAFNFDGSHPHKLTIGATGGERIKIELTGLPAHAGLAPEQGASAIEAAGLAIARLKTKGWLGQVKKSGRKGTSNIGVIRGGDATNVVTEYVELAAEARSHDGEFRLEIADAIEAAFVESAAKVKSKSGVAVQATVARRVDYESFRLAEDSQPVQLASEAIAATGVTPETAISNGGVDANWLNRHGIPTLTLGCGQREVHTKDEWLDVPEFLAACEIARSVIANAG